MNILIVGCGRVGSTLAMTLFEKGNDVAVLDRSQANLDALDDGFGGLSYCGVPIDTEMLKQAGIGSCDIVCAVTDDDNTNLMVSELAKSIFNIPMVLTRVFDSEKGAIFETMGMRTVCSTALTVDAICTAIESYEDIQYVKLGNHSLKFFTVQAPKNYEGEKVSEIELEENEELYGIISADGTLKRVTDGETLIEENDKIVFTKLL